jgi:Family of unknown function (DUF6519)
MSTIDLSRQATDPRKHYAGVRMQQGRVLTDDDFNEAAAIDAEELRRTRLHAIGTYGTPDAGFLPKDFTVVGGKLDFKLSTGNLYLGGLRLEMSAEERFLLQKDWLNFDPAVDAQTAPANGQTRTDLVWIEAWQQPVTAVEDSELFEVALGGPDTTTRWRTMRRVHVTPGVVETECASAWSTVSAGFGALGTITADMELATTATLTVGFTVPPVTGDLCSPPQAGGYLGAENQAVRVQMVDPTHYTWGFDNAAPLYRVQLSAKNGQLIKLTLLNQPKDAVHWPLKGQVVELLPWSAALANTERVADLAGHLCKVSVSYNPNDHTLEIDTPVPATFGAQWKSRSDKGEFFDGTPAQDFFYLRVWNRGDDIASPAAVPIATAALGNTGLQVTFGGGPLRAADYWIIAARPATPNAVVPLVLSSGAGPNGVKRYRAPIALIQWKTQANVTTGSVIHDCRPPFLPLTRIRGCCSVTVGDGTQSFGMFTSVQAAVNALPASGGTVCILPGRYQESVTIAARINVTLHGCGPRSRIVAPAEAGTGSTAVHITDSKDVVVDSLALEGGIAAVVRVERSTAVRIASCLVQARDRREVFSPWPAVFAHGELIEIEDNIIEALPDDLHRVFHKVAAADRGRTAHSARGGIQLAGGCENVRVAGNVIVGGAGNGITLGSILRIDTTHPNGERVPDIDVDDPCAPCDPTDSGVPPDNGGTVTYESAGDLYDIDIDDNVITRQGANGISVVRFFGFSEAKGLVLVVVHGLRIAHNRITGCLRRVVAQAPSKTKLLLGYGGISLAFTTELEIESNVVEGNGRDWLNPVCGVFVLAVDGLLVQHNRIAGNGERNEEPVDSAHPGIRAGVHVWLALAMGIDKRAKHKAASVAPLPAPTATSQLRVHGNTVEQPLGRALFMLGAGPIAITDNHLVSTGTGAPATDPIASTVLVANFGFSREWTSGLLMTLAYLLWLTMFKFAPISASAQLICDMSKLSRFMPGFWPLLPTGKLMFNDNQVSFLMRDAPMGLDLSSVLLLSLDDVSACDNQFECHTQQRLVLADLLAFAVSLRSNDNRLAETWGRAARSILSLALMNTAADNQSTHCITALGLQRAVHSNLVLAQAFCADACGDEPAVLGNIAVGAQTVMSNRRQ